MPERTHARRMPPVRPSALVKQKLSGTQILSLARHCWDTYGPGAAYEVSLDGDPTSELVVVDVKTDGIALLWKHELLGRKK